MSIKKLMSVVFLTILLCSVGASSRILAYRIKMTFEPNLVDAINKKHPNTSGSIITECQDHTVFNKAWVAWVLQGHGWSQDAVDDTINLLKTLPKGELEVDWYVSRIRGSSEIDLPFSIDYITDTVEKLTGKRLDESSTVELELYLKG
ncbi:MAG: hypothetical protein NkDv07_0674 [Candidatus Improbicoccus devescovinae]|nr:MAG: hypothetical protein NkDv07_0674 [Candidatus Improbicoccus devescovinae]